MIRKQDKDEAFLKIYLTSLTSILFISFTCFHSYEVDLILAYLCGQKSPLFPFFFMFKQLLLFCIQLVN